MMIMMMVLIITMLLLVVLLLLMTLHVLSALLDSTWCTWLMTSSSHCFYVLCVDHVLITTCWLISLLCYVHLGIMLAAFIIWTRARIASPFRRSPAYASGPTCAFRCCHLSSTCCGRCLCDLVSDKRLKHISQVQLELVILRSHGARSWLGAGPTAASQIVGGCRLQIEILEAGVVKQIGPLYYYHDTDLVLALSF